MNAANGALGANTVPAELLGDLYRRGVRLWADQGLLRYQAPAGSLTAEDLGLLKRWKPAILAQLERSAAAGPDVPEAATMRDLPLAFSQLSHWSLYRLDQKPAIRQIASATRMRGRLDLTALERSVAEIVRRHDALRIRVVRGEGEPAQEVLASRSIRIVVEHVSAREELEREAAVQGYIEQSILEPIDLTRDPLVAIRLVQLAPEDHVLIVTMEHIISDHYSMGIFLRELFAAYTQISQNEPLQLPVVALQFSDYCVDQRRGLGAWLDEHGAYWRERLGPTSRLVFPPDPDVPAGSEPGWGMAPFSLDTAFNRQLREWCRGRGTTLVIAMFTAYTAVLLRWCGVREALIQYQSDGRLDPDTENTIGYFASVLYLRVRLSGEGTLADLMRHVTEEYCSAYEHVDSCYMEAQLPRPEFSLNSGFNWVTEASAPEVVSMGAGHGALECSPVLYSHPLLKIVDRDNEPIVRIFERPAEILGGIYFPRKRFSTAAMERFGREIVRFAKILVEHPQAQVLNVPEESPLTSTPP